MLVSRGTADRASVERRRGNPGMTVANRHQPALPRILRPPFARSAGNNGFDRSLRPGGAKESHERSRPADTAIQEADICAVAYE